MHELSVTQNILNISLHYAEQANAKRILNINLVIGKLSSIVDDSVQFYWDTIARGTIAEGARLHFNSIPVEMVCLDCGLTFEPSETTFTCPECQNSRINITHGDEFRVDSIDIE